MKDRHNPPRDHNACLRPQEADTHPAAQWLELRPSNGGLLAALAAGVADVGSRDSIVEVPWNLRIDLDEAGTQKP